MQQPLLSLGAALLSLLNSCFSITRLTTGFFVPAESRERFLQEQSMHRSWGLGKARINGFVPLSQASSESRLSLPARAVQSLWSVWEVGLGSEG